MKILLILFIVILNFSIFKLLDYFKSVKSRIILSIGLFLFIVGIIKLYINFYEKSFFQPFGFFLLLNFSLGIIVFPMISSNIFKNIFEELFEKDNSKKYRFVIAILITVLQIFMVTFEVLNKLKN